MGDTHKQILKNQIKIMEFLSAFRSLIEHTQNKDIDEDAAWVFEDTIKETEKLLKEE